MWGTPVSGLVNWLERRFCPEVPALRLAALRALIGLFAFVYLSIRLLHLLRYRDFPAAQFAPVGVVSWLGLTAPLPSWAVVSSVLFTWVASLGFTLGVAHRILSPLFAFGLLWILTYRSSWGMVFHTENLLVLHVIILALAPSADTFAFGKSRRSESGARYGTPIRLMGFVTVLAYFVAGVAKLRNAGWAWSSGDVLQVQVAYDNLRKLSLGDFYSPLGGFLVGFAWLWPPLATLSLVMELSAPLAFLGDRVGRWWSFVAFSFHLGVLAMMAINFPYPLSFVAFASFFAAERLLRFLPQRWRERWRLA